MVLIKHTWALPLPTCPIYVSPRCFKVNIDHKFSITKFVGRNADASRCWQDNSGDIRIIGRDILPHMTLPRLSVCSHNKLLQCVCSMAASKSILVIK